MNSWQLAHLSDKIPAGDYQTKILPDKARWGARPVIVHENGIVSVKHHLRDGRQHWVLPGGGVEKGETIPEAGIREAQEECNINISLIRLLYVRVWYFQRPVVEFYPLAKIKSGTISLGHDPDSPDGTQILKDIRVISFDELQNDDNLTFYPVFMRKRIQRDLEHPPTKALYVGTTP